MHETSLVQRLRCPWRRDDEPLPVASRVFLPTTVPGTPEWKEAATMLHQFISCDTMGAAEYEFGTFREAIARVARDSEELVAFQMVLKASEIHRTIAATSRSTRAEASRRRSSRFVHPSSIERSTCCAACRRRTKSASGFRQLVGRRWRVKMGTRFDLALDPVEKWDADIVGWLELNNGFFFFLDKDMWTATTMMFTGKPTPTHVFTLLDGTEIPVQVELRGDPIAVDADGHRWATNCGVLDTWWTCVDRQITKLKAVREV